MKGAFCTLGFDGARFRDSTAFVLTEIETGLQQILGLWERPTNLPDDAKWEVDHQDVDGVLAQAMSDYEIWRSYCDPPYWVETVADWVARYPEQIVEWWTNRPRAMAYALRNYTEAIDSESIAFGGSDVGDLIRHIGHAGRKDLKIRDDEDVPCGCCRSRMASCRTSSTPAWPACCHGRLAPMRFARAQSHVRR